MRKNHPNKKVSCSYIRARRQAIANFRSGFSLGGRPLTRAQAHQR